MAIQNKPSIRYLKEMSMVVFDKDFAKANPELELYQVYREVKKDGDLRYDVTIIPAQMLGKEFVRTKGNRNSQGYQELYTVLEGEGIFLMQKVNGDIVNDVFCVKAKPGEWIIVPPDYAVVTINSSKTEGLETGNWVSERTENIYEEIEKMEGACYFYTKGGWIKNEKYKKIPEIRLEKPMEKEPESLDFLRYGMEQ